MPHSNQARKRLRQSEKLHIRNRSTRKEIKTTAKKIAAAVAQKDSAQARQLLVEVFSQLDKAKKRSVLHWKSADRRKSQLARIVNTLGEA